MYTQADLGGRVGTCHICFLSCGTEEPRDDSSSGLSVSCLTGLRSLVMSGDVTGLPPVCLLSDMA